MVSFDDSTAAFREKDISPMSDPEATNPPVKPKWWANALAWALENPAVVLPTIAFLGGVVMGKWVL